MKLTTLLLIIAAIVLIVIIVVWIVVPSVSSSVIHTLIYDEKTLHTSGSPIIATSNKADEILYATSKGIVSYNVETEETKLLNDTIAKGLAFDGKNYLALDANNLLYVLDSEGKPQHYQAGVNAIYDTLDGFYIQIGDVKSSTGDITPANGDYGIIQFKVS